jgi:hypothetical protein
MSRHAAKHCTQGAVSGAEYSSLRCFYSVRKLSCTLCTHDETKTMTTTTRKDMNDSEKQQNFAALLNANWEDVQTLPDFATFPAGTYLFKTKRCVANMERNSIDVTLELEAVLELANQLDAEHVPPAGSMHFESFRFEFDGVEKFKKVFSDIALQLGTSGPADLIEQFVPLEIVATISTRVDKNDKTKVYSNLKSAVLAS